MKFNAMLFDGSQVELDTDDAVSVDYTNHRGERGVRHVIPLSLPPRKMPTDHQYHPGAWVIEVWDLDRQAQRSYALKDIHSWEERKL
jgi:hypothetical protein